MPSDTEPTETQREAFDLLKIAHSYLQEVAAGKRFTAKDRSDAEHDAWRIARIVEDLSDGK